MSERILFKRVREEAGGFKWVALYPSMRANRIILDNKVDPIGGGYGLERL